MRVEGLGGGEGGGRRERRHGVRREASRREPWVKRFEEREADKMDRLRYETQQQSPRSSQSFHLPSLAAAT